MIFVFNVVVFVFDVVVFVFDVVVFVGFVVADVDGFANVAFEVVIVEVSFVNDVVGVCFCFCFFFCEIFLYFDTLVLNSQMQLKKN